MEELPIRKLDPAARVPVRAHPGDAGLDLCSVEGLSLEPGGRASVGTGLAVAIPSGLAGLILPRSGLASEHGIALVNSPGLIDSGYRGEIRILLLNTDRQEEFAVEPGDRIAQLLIIPFTQMAVSEVPELSDSERGDSGFGSSGRR
ncbi:MAG: dUTP diphosphatase [bacterium]